MLSWDWSPRSRETQNGAFPGFLGSWVSVAQGWLSQEVMRAGWGAAHPCPGAGGVLAGRQQGADLIVEAHFGVRVITWGDP